MMINRILSGGFQKLTEKAVKYWLDAGEEDAGGKRMKKVPEGTAGIAAAASAERSEEKKSMPAALEESTEKKVNQAEGAVSGGLKRFLYNFKETAVKAVKALGRAGGKRIPPAEESADIKTLDSSYLLDSYNKSGQYSTLAKDHSLEGNFRAKG